MNHMACHSPLRLWVLCLLISVAGCKEGDSPTPSDPLDVPDATRLILQPEALLLQGAGTTHELTVRAVDAEGHSIDVSSLQLEFASSSPDEVSISINASGRVMATARGVVGSAHLVARSRRIQGLTSNPVAAVVASLKPGVQAVEDARVVFPPPNVSRGLVPGERLPDISSPDIGGHVRIGSFSDEEVLALYEPKHDAAGVPTQLLMPVVLRGASPATGSLLFASEGALVMGRVVRAEEREGFSLVQLETVELTAFFTNLRFRFDSQALRDTGFLEQDTPQQLHQGLSPSDVIKCEGRLGFEVTDASFRIKDWEVEPLTRFHVEVSDGSVSSVLLDVGMNLHGVIEAEAGLQATTTTEFTCKLPAKPLETPSVGPPGPWAFIISVKASLQFLVEGEFSLSAGDPGKLVAHSEVDLPLSVGLEWTRSGGMKPRKSGEPTIKTEVTTKGNLFTDSPLDFAFKAEGKLGVYADLKFLAITGGKLTEVIDIITDLFPFFSAEFKKVMGSLKWSLVELRVGPEILVNFNSSLQALSDRSDEGELLLQAFSKTRVLPEFIDFLQEHFGSEDPAGDDTPALTWNMELKLRKWPALRRELSNEDVEGCGDGGEAGFRADDACKTRIRARRSGGAWVEASTPLFVSEGQTVEIEVKTASVPDAPVDLALYRLRAQESAADREGQLPGGSPSTGRWTVPEGFCDESSEEAVEIHVIGTNKLSGMISTSSYLGAVTLTCAPFVFRVNGQLLADPNTPFKVTDEFCNALELDVQVAEGIEGHPKLSSELVLDGASKGQFLGGDDSSNPHVQVRTGVLGGNYQWNVWLDFPDLKDGTGSKIERTRRLEIGECAPFQCTNQGQLLQKNDWVTLAPPFCPVSVPLECKTGIATQNLAPDFRARLMQADGGEEELSKKEEANASILFAENSLTKGENLLDVVLNLLRPGTQERMGVGGPHHLQVVCVKKVRPYFPPIPPSPAQLSGGFGYGYYGGGGGVTHPCLGCFFVPTWFRPISLTWGDPHLTTADGRNWTAYQLGEFWLVRPRAGSPPGGIQVQARHQRLPGFATWASFNTAAAVQVGPYTFEVRMPRDGDGSIRLDKRRELELLINGERTSLHPQMYVVSNDLSFRVAQGNGLEILYRDPTAVLPLQHPDAAFTRIRIGTSGEAGLVRTGGDPSEPVISIDVSVETSGSYVGLLGTPDGNPDNEFMKPDGTVLAGPIAEFVNSHLLQEASASLFTYQFGEGPATFAVPQSSTLPNSSTLGPYLTRVRTLLTGTCGLTDSEVAAMEPDFLEQFAYELAAGRTEKNMVAAGICNDGQVRPLSEYVTFVLGGKVTLAGRPDVGVGGARVRIVARELGRQLCDTVTIEDGRYGCGLNQEAADYANLLAVTLDYTISGRGAELTKSIVTAPPLPNTALNQSQDFEAVVSRVLDIRGRVRDSEGVLMSGALVRIESPQSADVLTDANGEYQRYLVLPDGIRSGILNLKTVSRDGRFSGSVSTGFDIPEVGIHTVFININALAVPGRLPPVQSQSWVRMNGKLLNALVQQFYGETKPIQGTTVRVRRKETGEELCNNAVSDPLGRWECGFVVATGTSGPLNLLVEADGLPSSRRELVVTAPELPGPGQVVTRSLDLTAKPTTLLFQGSVTTPTGVGLGDVEVSFEPLGHRRLSARTVSDGTYRAFLSLPLETSFGGPAEAVATLKGAGGTGSLERRTTPVLSVPAGVVKTFTWDVSFSTGAAVLSGRVLNELAGDAPVSGARVRVTTVGRTLCESMTNEDGIYGCSVSNEGGGTHQLTYSVDLRGVGTFTEFDGEPATLDLSKIPPAVVTPILPTRALRVRPTTVRVQGVVRDTSGRSVAGAQVGASMDGLRASTIYSAEDGRFTLALPLEEGQLSGKVRLSASLALEAGALTAYAEPVFTATVPHGLVELPVVLTLSGLVPAEDTASRLHFMGRVTNALAPGVPVAAAEVEVRLGAGGPKVCSGRTDDHGDYDCRILLAPAPPTPSEFEYTLRVAGIPMGAPVLRSWSFPRSAVMETRLMLDLIGQPTTLELRGRVTSDGTTPVAGVQVNLGGTATGSAQTDEQGDYKLIAALSPSSTSFEGTLTASINGLSTTRAVSGSLVAGQLTRRTEDLQFSQRRLKLRGTVRNTLAVESLVREARVELRREGSLLCETNLSSLTGGGRGFTCPTDLVLADTTPVTLEWTARNAIEQQTGTVTLGASDIPPAGQVGEKNLSLSLRATTLVVEGTVRNAAGSLVGGAAVRAAATGSLVEGLTAEDGTYHLTLALPDVLDLIQDDQPATNLTVEVRSGTDLGTANGVIIAPRGQLTRTTRDVGFSDVTRLRFTGKVVNSNGSNKPVRHAQVRILREGVDPSLGVLCEAEMNSPAALGDTYECARQLHGETLTSLTVRYQLLLQNTPIAPDVVKTYPLTPGAGVENKWSEQLTTSPTTVVISGTMYDSSGSPMQGGLVKLASGRGRSVTTDTYGKYTLEPLPFPTGTPSFQDTVVVTRDGYNSTRAITLSPLAQGLTNAIQADVTMAERRITFTGRISNSRAPGDRFADVQVKLKVGGTVFCETTTSGVTGSASNFNCAGKTLARADDRAFDVVWEATSSWGNASGVRPVLQTELPTSGQVGTLTLDGSVPVTMLKVSGVLRRDGAPLEGVLVRFDKMDSYTWGVTSMKTDKDGRYALNLFYPASYSSYSVSLFMWDGVNSSNPSLSGTLSPGEINLVEHDFNTSKAGPGWIAWTQSIDAPLPGFYSPPVMGGDAIIVPGDKSIRALRVTDGSEQWRASLGSTVTSVPVVGEEGNVYIGDDLGQVQAISPMGTLLWKGYAPFDPASVVTLAMGYNFIYAAQGNKVRAYRTVDGQLMWTSSLDGNITALMVSPYGYLLASGSGLYAVNESNGARLWRIDEGGLPAIGPDNRIVVAVGGVLKKLDIEGRQVWSLNIGSTPCAGPVIARDGTIFLPTYGEELVKVSSRGVKLGSVTVDKHYGDLCSSSPMLGEDGSIYVGSAGSKPGFHVLGSDLVERWAFTRPYESYEPGFGVPTLVGGKVLVTSKTKIFAVNTGAIAGMMSDCWARRYRDEMNSSRSPASGGYRQIALRGVAVNSNKGSLPTATPLPNFEVTLVRTSDGTKLGSTLTDGSGAYSFHWLAETSTGENVSVIAKGPLGFGIGYTVETPLHIEAGDAELVTKELDLQIPVTTLEYTGTIRSGGAPVQDAQVSASPPIGGIFSVIGSSEGSTETGNYTIQFLYSAAHTPMGGKNTVIRAEKASLGADSYFRTMTILPGELTAINQDLELTASPPALWNHSLPTDCVLSKTTVFSSSRLYHEELMVGGENGDVYLRVDCDNGTSKSPTVLRVSGDGAESNRSTLNGSPYFFQAAMGQPHPGPDGRLYVGGSRLVVLTHDLKVLGEYEPTAGTRIGQPLVTVTPEGIVQVTATQMTSSGGRESGHLVSLKFDPEAGTFTQLWTEPMAVAQVSYSGLDPLPVPGSGSDVAYVLHGNVLKAFSLAPDESPRVRFSRMIDPALSRPSEERLAVWTAVGGDQIRVVHLNKGISSFTSTGEPSLGWPYSTVAPQNIFISVSSTGALYFIGPDDALYSLSPEGALRWSYGASFRGRTTVDEAGHIYVASWRDVFALADTATGPVVLWKYYGLGKTMAAAPLVTPSAVIMLMDDGELRAIPR